MRRSELNQTEVQGVDQSRAYPEDLQQIGNWSDDGAQVQRQNYHQNHEDAQDEHPFGKLGQSYPLYRKMTGPQPFMSLGVATKPYKARRKRKNEQLLADQRRAKFSMGSDRMVKLENIYIKHGLANTLKTSAANQQ